jgi:hypothetical protein
VGPTRLAVGIAVVILVGSLLPMPPTEPAVLSLPSTDGSSPVGLFGVGIDKWVHGLSYAVLGGMVAAVRGRRTAVDLLAVVVVVAAFGAGIEVAQMAIPGRTGGSTDALANALGAVVGTAGWWLWADRSGVSVDSVD